MDTHWTEAGKKTFPYFFFFQKKIRDFGAKRTDLNSSAQSFLKLENWAGISLELRPMKEGSILRVISSEQENIFFLKMDAACPTS